METVAAIDFETTDMSPVAGARATEIAALLVRDGRVSAGRAQCVVRLPVPGRGAGPGREELGTLVEFAGLPVAGRHHRALADAEMAASLLLKLGQELQRRFGLGPVTHALLREIQMSPRGAPHGFALRNRGRGQVR